LSPAIAELTDQARHPVGPALGQLVSDIVGRVVSFDGYCLIGFDPISGNRSFQFSRNGLNGARQLAYNETIQQDVNRYVDLARAEIPAGVLGSGEPHDCRSFRLREILQPAGFHSELRLAVRGGGRLWGALVLFREDPLNPFTREECVDAATLGAPLAHALRAHPIRTIPADVPALAPGLVLLDPQNNIIAITTEAQAWLGDLVTPAPDETGPEDLTRVLYDAANAARAKSVGAGATRLRTFSGRWLAVMGQRIDNHEADVAVMLYAADLHTLLPAVAAWYQLSARQAQVLERLMRGDPTKHIARDLRITRLTVNDHLKALYRKTGARGRDELLGLLSGLGTPW
jgi:DNA-binding CsgD family transcriptional regulator